MAWVQSRMLSRHGTREKRMINATEKLKDLIMEVFDMRPSTAEKCIAILDDIKAIVENEEKKRFKDATD